MNFHKLRNITRIAVPAIAESLAAVIVTSIDTKMVSNLGPQAICGISFTTQPKLMLFAIFFALGTALNVFIAHAFGRKDREEQSMDPDLIFVEEVLVKPQYTETGRIPATLTIINRYRYSEYDTIVLEDYRIGCPVFV